MRVAPEENTVMLTKIEAPMKSSSGPWNVDISVSFWRETWPRPSEICSQGEREKKRWFLGEQRRVDGGEVGVGRGQDSVTSTFCRELWMSIRLECSFTPKMARACPSTGSLNTYLGVGEGHSIGSEAPTQPHVVAEMSCMSS